MCEGIAVGWRDFTEEQVAAYALEARSIHRGQSTEREFRFLYRDPAPQLPAWCGSRLSVCEWGNRDGQSRRLPRAGCLRLDALESGSLVWMQPEPVDVPACCGQQRGVWFPIRQGLRAVLVQDERGQEHIYLLIQPASHYYNVMTRSEWMPVLIDETPAGTSRRRHAGQDQPRGPGSERKDCGGQAREAQAGSCLRRSTAGPTRASAVSGTAASDQ